MAGLSAGAGEGRTVLGIGLVLTAYAWFSFVDASAKWLVIWGYPVIQLAFMRYIAHFIISGTRIMRGGISWECFHTSHPALVVLRGVCILGATVCNFLALKYIPLTLTSTILFSAPIIVCLLSGVLLDEQVGRWRWLAVILGFAGVVIAIRPFNDDFHWATMVSFLGAVCFSLYLILTRRLSGHASADTMQFYAGLVGCLTLLPFALAQWQAPESMLHGLLLVGLGVFAWTGHEFLTRAYGYADASVLTPYTYSFMIYLTLWSIVLFDELPDGWTMLGAVTIVLSGLVIWFRENRAGPVRSKQAA